MPTKLLLQVVLVLGLLVPTLEAQFEPFGVDVEHISVSHCGPNVYRSDAYGSGLPAHDFVGQCIGNI